MKEKIKTLATGVAAALLIFTCGCSGKTVYLLPYYDEIGNGYNSELFYKNDMTAFGADPDCIYIDDETDKENYGWFFMYPTSDYDYSALGITAYRSRDMINWEPVGVVYEPSENSYGQSDFWAPEVIFDEEVDRSAYGFGEGKGVYFLFYSSNDCYNSEELVFATHTDEQAYRELKETISGESFSVLENLIENWESVYIEGTVTSEEYDAENAEEIVGYLTEYREECVGAESEEKREAAENACLAILSVGIEKTLVRNDYSIGVAVSVSPAGPFVQYINDGDDGNRKLTERDPFLCSEDMTEYAAAAEKILTEDERGFSMIDASPYVDPVTGKKYLYFVRRFSRLYLESSFICGMEMGERWTDDPKWETLTRLTSCNYTEAGGTEAADTESSSNTINEGPFMYYRDGTYYLTYSVDNYNKRTYSVAQALSSSPLGKYTKVMKNDGGFVLNSDGRNSVSGAGHHSLVEYGGELYIVYHAHWNRDEGNGQRGICVDKIYFTENGKGQSVMACNGPTYTVQPLIGPDAEYRNIAGDAEVSATNCAAESTVYLTDGKIAVYSFVDFVKEFEGRSGTTEITLDFGEYRNVRALMIYNARDSAKMFGSVASIEFSFRKETENGTTERVAVIYGLPFDADANLSQTGVLNQCSAAIAEFEELSVKSIKITFKTSAAFNVSEICVLGW